MATAVDRRLPAIYDALDSGNNKAGLHYQLLPSRPSAFIFSTACSAAALRMQAAVKLINTALQKNTKHQMLRVLKAVALQRSGKLDEGLQVTVWHC